MKITTVGMDLAKNVFQVHGADERGKAVLSKQLRRNDVVRFFANLQTCVIGIEACGSAHRWALVRDYFSYLNSWKRPRAVGDACAMSMTTN